MALEIDSHENGGTTDHGFDGNLTNEGLSNEMGNVEHNAVNKHTGLTSAEENDPNRIHVEITDHQTPLVVFFGPSDCGKTMTLVRLARYLRLKANYRITPIENFRPSSDTVYKKMCSEFPNMINNTVAASGTGHVNFLLAKVFDEKGTAICQLLEGPGELYFNSNKAIQEFPTFIKEIFSDSTLRKVFVFFVESNKYEGSFRNNYSSTLAQIRRECEAMNTSIFLHNKIDLTDFVIKPGIINTKESTRAIANEYNGIFEQFTSKGLFMKRKEYIYVPFSTGSYTTDSKEEKQYTQGSDTYPKELWDAIMRCVRR